MEIAVAMAVATIVAGVAQAGIGVVQGHQASQAAKLEKEQFRDEERSQVLAADQEENQRRKRLESILSLNDALRGARGLSQGTGTDLALRGANIEEAEDDIATGRMNRLALAQRARYGAYGASLRQRGGLLSGAGAVVSGLGTAAGSYQKSFGGKAG